MKKLVMLCLALVIVLSYLSSFAQSENLRQAAFELRGGLKWGITEQEVLKLLEDTEGIVPNIKAGESSYVVYEANDVQVSDYRCTMSLFILRDYGLTEIRYYFSESNHVTSSELRSKYLSLKTTLTSKYGKPDKDTEKTARWDREDLFIEGERQYPYGDIDNHTEDSEDVWERVERLFETPTADIADDIWNGKDYYIELSCGRAGYKRGYVDHNVPRISIEYSAPNAHDLYLKQVELIHEKNMEYGL